MTKAIIVVDMVKGFTKPATKDGPCVFYMKNAESIIPKINELIKSVNVGDYIYYIRDAHKSDCLEYTYLPRHCEEGTEEAWLDERIYRFPEAEVDESVDVDPKFDGTYPKNHVNCFMDFDITKDFQKDGVKPEIVICGIATEMCVDSAVRGFVERGYKVKVFRDAIAGLDDELAKATIRIWEKFYGVRVV